MDNHKEEKSDGSVYLLAFPANFEEQALDLGSAWNRVRPGILPALIAGLFVAALAYAVTFALPRWYRAQAVLMATESPAGLESALGGLSGTLGGLAGLAGISLDDAGSSKAESLAILRSREFVEQFIARHEIMPKLFASDWDTTGNTWLLPPDDAPTLEDGYRYFDEQVLLVSENRAAATITITIEWQNSLEAAEWANLMVEDINEYVRQRAVNEATRSIEFLQAELTRTNDLNLKETMYSLIQEQLAKSMLANVRKEFAFRVVDPAKAAAADRSVRPRRIVIALAFFLVTSLLTLALVLRREGRD